MTRRFRLGLVFCLVALGLGAVLTAAAALSVTVTDDSGTIIRLGARPTRIVSLTPSNTEILFALGLDREIVGVTRYCDFPAAARSKEKIGDLNLDYEKIVALQPDLVLAVGSMQAEAIGRLRSLGLKVMVLNPMDLASTMAAIQKVGRVTRRDAAARKLIAGMERRLAEVRRCLAGLAEADRPRVFVEIWMDPVMTAGPGTFTAELVQLAGGRDIASDAKPWSPFSQELILTRNPQVIISQCGSAAQILKRAGWGNVDAVRHAWVHDVDQNIFSRPGPRLVDALEVMARLLHPERFKPASG